MAGGRRLAVTVVVYDPESGEPRTLLAGTEVSEADAKLISNPDVWDTGEEKDLGPVPDAGRFRPDMGGPVAEDPAVAAAMAAAAEEAEPSPGRGRPRKTEASG